jgi:hypothetical protein
MNLPSSQKKICPNITQNQQPTERRERVPTPGSQARNAKENPTRGKTHHWRNARALAKGKKKNYSGRTLAENKIREVISLSEPEDFPLGH